MKRVALILAIIGILCVAVGNVQAGGYHHGHATYHGAVHSGYYGGYHGGCYHGGYVRSPVWVAPYPVYAPAYRYGYYYPGPSYGFYYQGRGLSIGVGF